MGYETALRGLEWKPIAEMEAFEPQGVRIGYHGIVSWVMAPYIAYRRGEVTSIYTHFYRPILPTPPKLERDEAQAQARHWREAAVKENERAMEYLNAAAEAQAHAADEAAPEVKP